MLISFSVFALAVAAAIVANLVTGIVISAYREIGVMKAVGFAPAQVVSVLVLQILLPALAACIIGIPAGTLLSQPLLANSSQPLGLACIPSFFRRTRPAHPGRRAGADRPGGDAPGPASWAAQACGSDCRRVGSSWHQRAMAPPPGGKALVSAGCELGSCEAFARPLRGALTMLAVLLGVTHRDRAAGVPRSFDLINNSETGAGRYQGTWMSSVHGPLATQYPLVSQETSWLRRLRQRTLPHLFSPALQAPSSSGRRGS